MSERPRRFFLPLIGLTLLFAAFGPAIGGVLFAPIVVRAGGAAWGGGGGKRRGICGHVRAWAGAGLRLCRRNRAGGGGGLRLRAVGRGGAGRRAARARRGDHRRRDHLLRLLVVRLARRRRSRRASAPTSAPSSRTWIEPWFPRGFDVTLRDAPGRLRRRRGPRLRDGGEPDRPDDAGRARARGRAAGAFGRRVK